MSLSEYVVASEFAHHDIQRDGDLVYEYKRTFTLHAKGCRLVGDRALSTADRRGEGVIASLAAHGLGTNGEMERGNEWEPVWVACPSCGAVDVPSEEWRSMARRSLAERGYGKPWTA